MVEGNSYAEFWIDLLMAVGDNHLLTRFGERGNIKNALHRFVEAGVWLGAVKGLEQGVRGPCVIAVAFDIVYYDPIIDRHSLRRC